MEDFWRPFPKDWVVAYLFSQKGDLGKNRKMECVPILKGDLGEFMATEKVEKHLKKKDRKTSSNLRKQAEKKLKKMGEKDLKHWPKDAQLEEKFSELQQAQKKLDHLASFPEMNPNPVVEVNADGSIQYLNPAAKKIFPDLQDMGHRHECLVDLESIGTLLKDQKKNYYIREIKVDGNWYHQSFHLTLGVDRIRIYSLDITERKQAEEALENALQESKQREAEVSALLQGSRAVLKYHEFKNSAQYIFDSCKNLIGATAGYIALLSKDGKENEVVFLDSGGLPCFVDPNLPMPIRGLREVAYRTGSAIYDNDFPKSEYIKFMPEGHTSLDNVLFAPLTISEKVIGLLGLANKSGGFNEGDARMASAFGEFAAIALYNSRTLESLETSEERFRSVVQTASDAIISVNGRGDIVFWNDSAKTIFGYSIEEVTGKPLTFMMPERFREAHQKAINRMVSTGKSTLIGKTLEIVGLRKDGSEFPIELSLATWSTKEGTFITGIIRDIAERKKLEEALRKYHDELEIQVQERTIELSRAYKKLEDQSKILEGFFTSTITPLVFLDRNFNFIRVNEAYAKACQRDISEFPGHNHFEFYPSDAKAIFEQVVETKTPYQAIARQFTFPDHPEWEETYWNWTLTPILNDEDEVEFLVFSLEDVTERKRAVRRTNATYVLLNLFSKKTVRKEYLDAAVDLIQNWSGCRCVGIRILDERNFIPYDSYTGFSQEFWESENLLSIQKDQCLCIRVVTGESDPQDMSVVTPRGSFRCDNTVKFINNLSEQEKKRYRGVCIQNGFLSVAIIPIRYLDKIVGAIHLADEKEAFVPPSIVEFIESMAPLIGEAINRFKLEEEIRESENRLRALSSQLLTVQENERKRIARELHDGLGQVLTAIKFKVENALQQEAEDQNISQEKSLETVIPMIRESIEEVRRIQMDLRPSTIDDLGILATIGWFTREFQKVYSHIQIEKQLDLQEAEVPNPLKIILYRITQEALNNIAKHSKADRVRLSLKKKEDGIELVVEDNGSGFDINNFKKGFGISSMRERTELSGGAFEIRSTPQKGTVIRASWPV
jgi:PAS domain S-box-containing protein